MDGMPKLERLPAGELCLYPSLQGLILLNFEYPPRHGRVAFLQQHSETGLPILVKGGKVLDVSLGPYGYLDCNDYRQGKYVRFTEDRFALFPDTVTHANVPSWVGLSVREVISAGFIELCLDDYPGLHVRCHGESLSLNCSSRGIEDCVLFSTLFGGARLELT